MKKMFLKLLCTESDADWLLRVWLPWFEYNILLVKYLRQVEREICFYCTRGVFFDCDDAGKHTGKKFVFLTQVLCYIGCLF